MPMYRRRGEYKGVHRLRIVPFDLAVTSHSLVQQTRPPNQPYGSELNDRCESGDDFKSPTHAPVYLLPLLFVLVVFLLVRWCLLCW
jgi:hypothetical protein